MAIKNLLIEDYVSYVKQNQGIGTAYDVEIGGNLTVTGTLTAGQEVIGAETITSSSANAFAVGRAGTTNPAFNVDASTASSATGLQIKSAAAGSGVALTTLSSGANEDLTISAKGTGLVNFGTQIRIMYDTPSLYFTDTSQAAAAGKFRITDTSDTLIIESRNGGDSAYETVATYKRLVNGGTTVAFAGAISASANTTADGIGVTQSNSSGAAFRGTGTSTQLVAFGANGKTNPVFNVDASAVSVATGLNVQGLAAGSGVYLKAISSGTNESLYLEGKGTGAVGIGNSLALQAGGTAQARLNVSSTANFGIYWGSGAPTVSAGQGSIYIRSDGSSTSTRMYINTNGSTAWTAVTTVA